MAPHSSILASRIPWTEEPGGLQSIGSQSQDRTEQLTDMHTWFSEFSWQGPGFKSPSLPSFPPLPCPVAPQSPISAFFI